MSDHQRPSVTPIEPPLSMAYCDYIAHTLVRPSLLNDSDTHSEYPLIVDDQKWYLISKIKGNNDILGMSHYLVFIENKYQYRESKK